MNDILKARDVLAKWRAGTSVAPWHACEPDDGEPLGITNRGWHGMVAEGTGADTNLLDAIDGMFTAALDWTDIYDGEVIYPEHIERIAGAIVAADDRMQQ